MSRARTITWTVVITLVVVAAGGGGTKLALDKWRPKAKPLAVQVKAVKRGPLVERVHAPGEVTPKKKVAISARVSARIVELPFEEGAAVTRGHPDATPPVPASVLVRLDDKDLRSKLRSAVAGKQAQEAQIDVEKARISSEEAAIEAATVSLAQAERDLERKQALQKSGDIGQATFDEVEAKVKAQRVQLSSSKLGLEAARRNLVVLERRLDMAQAQIEEAQETLTYTTVVSPIDGTVTRLNAEVGELVMTGTMNNPGTVIIEVADLSHMLVVAQIDEADMGRLAVGQLASIHLQAYGERKFTGRVESIPLISSRSPSGTIVYRVEILLEASDLRLYTGLTADVEIETREHTEVLLVPSQAVVGRKVEDLPKDIREKSPNVDQNKAYATVVYRLVRGKAVVTPVAIGPADLTQTIITAGLAEGDRVVVGPYKVLDNLRHDAQIEEEGKAVAAPAAAPKT